MIKKPHLAALYDTVEDAVLWEHGTGSGWQCDAVIGAVFLRELAHLAAKAKAADVRAFIDRWDTGAERED
jgi:hypothetical protein